MPAYAPIRPRIAQWRDWLPLAVLLAALSSLFVLGGDRGWFYRSGDGMERPLSHETLAIAENLSPEHNFLMTLGAWEREDGSFKHDPYNRFPVGGFALVRLAMLPFGSDLAAKLTAGRVLALLMFCGAAIFAYLALARIAESRWIALAAVLLAFSGIYAVYHADFVLTQTMDLFGVMLVFHGIAVFVQEGRFRQLLIKACAALLLGWHVYALIMPFALLGFAGEAVALVRAALASGGGIRAAAALRALVRSRFIALAAVSILFGSALLALNFANEYAAYGGSRSLLNLPSVRSMTGRLGAADFDRSMPGGVWGDFSMRQLYRAGASSAPYAVAGLAGREFSAIEPWAPSPAWAAWGFAAAVAALAGLALVPRRFRALMAAVALTGFCWAVALRNNTYPAYHSFEGLHYIGLPLALWCVALIGARRLLGGRLGGAAAIGAAALAAPLFALSVAYAAQVDRDDLRAAERSKAELAEFSAIMEMARGKRVVIASPYPEWGFYDSHVRYSLGHYLAGSYTLMSEDCESLPPDRMDFVLSAHRDESLDLLTPDNRFAFLYASTDPLELCRSERRRLESSEPLARSTFDVYFQTDPPALHYLKPDCAPEDGEAPFFIYAHSENPSDAPAEWESWRFSPTQFLRRAEFDGACLMTFYLRVPALLISHFQTGQYISGGGRLWEVAASPPPSAERVAAYESEYQAIAAREPAAQSGFDIHLDADGGAIRYLKQPCSEEDARGRFFLSVHPADAGDLPAERRELGHESLNFNFEPPHGAVFNGKCMATIQLPDYEIAKIETGQDAPGGGRLWDAAVAVGE